MKKLFAVILAIVLVFALAACGTSSPAEEPTESIYNVYTINGKPQSVQSYFPIEDAFVAEIVSLGYINFDIYEPDEITNDMMTNRTKSKRLIVERIIGIVTSAEGDGQILNTSDSEHDYISYKNVDLDYKMGTVMITYCLYNPDTNYEDDILERYDYVLDREYEG